MAIPLLSFPGNAVRIAFSASGRSEIQSGQALLTPLIETKEMLGDLLSELKRLEAVLDQARPGEMTARD